MQTLKEKKMFNSNESFYNHVINALKAEKTCHFYEMYNKKTEVEDWTPGEEYDVDYNLYFLSEDLTLQKIAVVLLTIFGDSILMQLKYEENVPIELEDGTKVYQKMLTAILWDDDEHPLCF